MLKKILFILCMVAGAPGFVCARDWDPRLIEASQLIYQGNAARAEGVINEYMADNPVDPNGYFVKGVVIEWKAALEGRNPAGVQREIVKLYERAADNAFQLWNQDQENPDRMVDLGNAYVFLARKYADVGENLKTVFTGKKCQKYLEEALKKDPSRTDGLLSLGGFHYLAASSSPSLAPFKALLGIKGSKEQGLAELKRSLGGHHPFVNDALYALLFINMDHEKNYEQAYYYQGELERRFPDNPEMKYKRGVIAEKQDKAKGAQAYLDFAKWCEANAGKCHKTYLFMSYYNAGRLYKDVGDKPKAKEYFAKALANNTNVFPQQAAEALYWPGLIEEGEGQSQLAADKFKKAKDTPGIPKGLRKEIENKLGELCRPDNAQVKC